MHGVSLRVPVVTVSAVDLVALLGQDVTAEEVNKAFKAAAEGPMHGILEYCAEELVSADFKGSAFSSSLDAMSTHGHRRQHGPRSWPGTTTNGVTHAASATSPPTSAATACWGK